jgi:hypothetical protein
MIRPSILWQTLFRATAFAAAFAYPQVSFLSFLKASFPSLDEVLTCIFLGTFCLKPHLRRMRHIYGYNDILWSC